jgi:hypothetical protein
VKRRPDRGNGTLPLFPTEEPPDPPPSVFPVADGDEGPRRPVPGWSLTRMDLIPDVRDGLTRVERVVLCCLAECEREKKGRMVSTAMLYGRVVEHVNLSVPQFQRILQRLVGVR